MAGLTLEIITPNKISFNGEVQSVTIPGTEGSFQVLKNHAPLMSTFEIGEVKVVLTGGNEKKYATGGGTVEVLNNHVLVLADSLEDVGEIDVERARSAKERAENRLTHKTDTTDVERAEQALKRAINRLRLVEKYIRAEV
ncbi:MAG TPA: F0F1 ATP synthase subunit epsilon [Ignavibacteriaceae bacterium]|jgi:F-type H+-transporting ATPase subunit epsilon|nr:F0F1 ATP synthase subunit epsilon [Ignavibacteriaceae bacterium]